MSPRRLTLLLALLVAALAATAAPASADSKVCVFVQERNVAQGALTGHAFVQLLPDRGAQAGQRDLVYGFYPKIQWRAAFGGPGKVDNDKDHGWDWRKCGFANDDVYKPILTKVTNDISSPPDYALLKFNCTDWAVDIANLAGIKLPSAKALGTGILDPEALAKNLEKEFESQGRRNIPNATGTVWHNSAKQKPTEVADFRVPGSGTGGDDERMSPGSYTDLVAGAFGQTRDLADGLGMTADTEDLPDVQLGVGDKLKLDFDGIDADKAVLAVRWGDGDETEQDATPNHEYRKPGDFHVRGIAIARNTVYRFAFTAHVDEQGGGAERKIDVPHHAPRPDELPPLDPPVAPLPLDG